MRQALLLLHLPEPAGAQHGLLPVQAALLPLPGRCILPPVHLVALANPGRSDRHLRCPHFDDALWNPCCIFGEIVTLATKEDTISITPCGEKGWIACLCLCPFVYFAGFPPFSCCAALLTVYQQRVPPQPGWAELWAADLSRLQHHS